MREQGFITPAQEAAARRVRPRDPAVPPAARRARAAGRRTTCASSSATSSAATIRPTGRCTRRSCRRCRTRPSARSRPGCERLNRPGLEAALVAIDPSTGDILAMVGGARLPRSTFNRATRSRRQPGSAFKPFVYAAALGARLFAGVGAVESATASRRRAIRSGRRATRDGEQPDALTLRAALLESNNAAAVDLQQQVGVARGAAPGRRRRASTTCPTCRRWRSAPASSRRSI